MKALNRGDVFSFQLSNQHTVIAFVKSGRTNLSLVFHDDKTNTLKEVKSYPSEKMIAQLLSYADMPPLLQSAYDKCFTILKKGTYVSFDLDGLTHTGFVIKGGSEITVEAVINGKTVYPKGPAHLFKAKI